MVNSSIANNFLDSLFARETLYTQTGKATYYTSGSESNKVEVPTYTAVPGLSTQCWIGVSTTEPSFSNGAISGFTEPASSTGYARSRLGVGGNDATLIMDAAANSVITNGTNFIFFDEAVTGGGGFGNVKWFGLFSAETGGQPLVAGKLTTAVDVNEGNVLIFRPSNLKISME